MSGKKMSIRTRLLFPILLVTLLQSLLFFALVCFGGIAGRLRSNAMDILNENAENSRLYLERELYEWMNVVREDQNIDEEIRQILAAENKAAADIRLDPALNETIIENASPTLIDILHRSYATGAFLILDGPAAENSGTDTRAGIYIRDLEPSKFAFDNSDLLLLRGAPSVSRKFGIPLDSYWNMGFQLEKGRSGAYFYQPFTEAVRNQASYAKRADYAYLSPPFKPEERDEAEAIAYSLPVIAGDGTVIGVIGVELSVGQIQRMLSYGKFSDSDMGISIMGMREKGSDTVKRIASVGAAYDRCFEGADALLCPQERGRTTAEITAADGSRWCVSAGDLGIYGVRTPFVDDQWVLMGMMPSEELLSGYDQLRRMFAFSLLITLVLSAAGMFIAGHIVTSPISRIVKELQSQQRENRLCLHRVNISEIDQLAAAVEELSADVAEASSRISRILEEARVSVGVFEYQEKPGTVFCSRLLYQIMGWEEPDAPYGYLGKQEFVSRMGRLERYEKEGPDVYMLKDGAPRWVRVIQSDETERTVLGALVDITPEVRERIKLERERDYDLLTDIFNRRAFKERVTELLEKRGREPAAMVMWDLDNLKYINDTYGHEDGDRYIRLFADNLRKLEDGGGIICRYAGDEFVAFLFDAGGKDGIRKRLKEFLDTLQASTLDMDNGYRIPQRVSGGIAWYPDDADRYDKLFSYADFAMYTVKHSVKGMIMEFDKQSFEDKSYMLAGREELNSLLEKRSVDFAFQPIVRRNGTVYGYELLMRPQLKKLKGIGEVLNLAREQAKLNQMEALTWLAGLASVDEMVKAGRIGEGERFFINSIASTRMSDEEIEEVERKYSPYLNRIVVEMTESEPTDNDCLAKKLKVAKGWGAGIAIDDFGSGHNGETILLTISPDIVKLDMHLVRSIDKDPNRRMILKNLIDYARRLEISVLGEGVETVEELEVLMGFGVELYQGYYIARPEKEIRPINPYIVDKMRELSMLSR